MVRVASIIRSCRARTADFSFRAPYGTIGACGSTSGTPIVIQPNGRGGDHNNKSIRFRSRIMAPCTETSMSFKLLSSFRSLRLPVLLVMLTGHLPLSAQEIPRLSNGLPDFNGVWQVLNEANWDLEPHIARHSVMMREGPVNAVPAAETLAAGAVLSVPGSMGSLKVAAAFPTTSRRAGSKRTMRRTGSPGILK